MLLGYLGRLEEFVVIHTVPFAYFGLFDFEIVVNDQGIWGALLEAWCSDGSSMNLLLAFWQIMSIARDVLLRRRGGLSSEVAYR